MYPQTYMYDMGILKMATRSMIQDKDWKNIKLYLKDLLQLTSGHERAIRPLTPFVIHTPVQKVARLKAVCLKTSEEEEE